ncbi:MAG: hypothetical protein WCG93_15270 [Paludibacter sp.]
MSKNSNQSGALLLLALILGATVYALMFFGNELEQTNMSASFGHLSKKTSVNLLTNNKVAAAVDFQAKEIRSDMSGVALPTHKMKSTSGGDYAQSSNPDFPSTGIDQSNGLNLNETTSGTRTSGSGNYARNQSQTFAFGNSDIQYISNPQNPTKSDINALLLLDTHAAEVAMTSNQQGSKRATQALAAKTASVSTSLASNGAKKIGGGSNPGEPGASLPVGDGILILLSMLGIYSFSRYLFSVLHYAFKQLQLILVSTISFRVL